MMLSFDLILLHSFYKNGGHDLPIKIFIINENFSLIKTN